MKKERQEALESAGFQIGGIEEFLGLSDEEVRLIELRVNIGRAIRRLRQARNLTQEAVGAMSKMTRPRVARVEEGLPGVTLDQAFRVLFAVGGDMGDIQARRVRATSSRQVGPTIDKATKGIKREA